VEVRRVPGTPSDETPDTRVDDATSRELAVLRRAHERATRLAAVTRALSEARTPDEVAGVVLEQARDGLAAYAGSIYLADPAASRLRLFRAVGYDDAQLARYGEIPVSARTPLSDAFRAAAPVIIHDAVQWRERYPELATEFRSASVAAVPLVVHEAVAGALGLSFRTRQEFSAHDVDFLRSLAQGCAQSLDRARLLELAQQARAEAESAQRRLALLAEASSALATSLDVDATVSTAFRLVVPMLAQCAVVQLLEESGTAARRSVCHPDAALQVALEALLERLVDERALGPGAAEALSSGRPVAWPPLDAAALDRHAVDERHRAELDRLPLTHGHVMPLTVRGRTFGTMTLLRAAPFAPFEQTLAEDVVRRIGVAIDNALTYQRDRQVAVTLQRSLLPVVPTSLPGVTLSCRYLAGAAGTEVGGDWYDVIPLSGDRLALVIGDVMGRGVAAAALMGQVKAAVRAYALEEHSPGGLMTRLDRVVSMLDDGHIVTCIYAIYDPHTGDLLVCSAGHLPPLVINPRGESDFVTMEVGPPLGVGGTLHTDMAITLLPGASLLFYTDGLVEGRQGSIDQGLDRLRAEFATAHSSADELIERALHALGRDDNHDDDTALLALMTAARPLDEHTPPGQRAAETNLAPEADSAGAARRFVEQALASWGYDALVPTAVLIVNEIVTNAIRHAGTPTLLRLVDLGNRLRVELVDGSSRLPVTQRADPEVDEGGRGVWLLDSLSHRWGVDHVAGGKRVWFELAGA